MMIDEQHVFRGRLQSDEPGVLDRLRELQTPRDIRTPSVTSVIAAYMRSRGDIVTAEVFESAVTHILHGRGPSDAIEALADLVCFYADDSDGDCDTDEHGPLRYLQRVFGMSESTREIVDASPAKPTGQDSRVSDVMLQPYRSALATARQQTDEVRSQLSDKEFFAWLATMAFENAASIVHGRGSIDAQSLMRHYAAVEVYIKAWQENPKRQCCWESWTYTPTAFGNYQQVGDSAVHTAILFSGAVYAAMGAAKLHCKKPFMSIDDTPPAVLETWPQAVRKELESTTLDFDDWTAGKFLRDKNMLLMAIQGELRDTLERSSSVEDKAIIKEPPKSQSIPAEKRTRKMTKEDALRYLGDMVPLKYRPIGKNAIRWLNECIEADPPEIRFEPARRKDGTPLRVGGYYHIDDFPPEIRDRLR